MAASTPNIYLLDGEDEYAISRFIAGLEAELGDPSIASMNINRLDGASFNPDALPSLASAMPFLAPRRLIVLTNVASRFSQQEARNGFLNRVVSIPPTTSLVLAEYRLLTPEKDRRKNQINWLEDWAQKHPEKVQIKHFLLPRAPELASWIREQAARNGGQIDGQAAALLSSLCGGDPRLAAQEIEKLLAYVNYHRPIHVEDVELLTANVGEANIFDMVDALGNRDGRRAMRLLQRLLEQQDPLITFAMIVRHFRQLIIARQALDSGAKRGEIASRLNVPNFVVDKIIGQVRHFSLPDLEDIYYDLLNVDIVMKTSQLPEELALTKFVAELTAPPYRDQAQT